ncbi:MAG: type II secretion system protein [Planctomycetota bacterium]|nr:type II secretion system protein [Planctomycetota bacterium]
MNRRTNPRNKEEGFTLLEVMIAIAVLGVVSLGSSMLLLPVLEEQNNSREVTSATGYARAVLEELYSRTLEDLTNDSTGYLLEGNWPKKGGQIFGDQLTLEQLADPSIPTVDVEIADLDSDPLEILVTVSWMGRDSSDLAEHQFWVVRTR